MKMRYYVFDRIVGALQKPEEERTQKSEKDKSENQRKPKSEKEQIWKAKEKKEDEKSRILVLLKFGVRPMNMLFFWRQE